MIERAAAIDAFLAIAGWRDARRVPLAGDASARRYVRLVLGTDRAILMDAPPESGEDIAPFLRAGLHLADRGLSVPNPLASDAEGGLLLMEDLGDAVFARLAERSPETERTLYLAATDALVHLHRTPPPEWARRYDPATMAAAIRPAREWYAGSSASGRWLALEALLRDLLAENAAETSVLLHRDYHAENLIWLPERDGVARVGILDFQDALAGHPAYDLASLLQDVRRDVDPALEREMIAHFTRRTGREPAAFARAYALQAAQRHLRILGIFTRLARERAKPGYLAFLPRTWACLMRNLDHPDLAGLKASVLDLLPSPEVAAAVERA